MWILKPGELARLRIASGLGIHELAKAANVNRRTIERLESGEYKRVKDRTAMDFAVALKCTRDDFAIYEQQVRLGLTPAPVSRAPAIAPTNPDTKQVQREAAMGIDRPLLALGDRDVPILSFTRKKQCELLYATLTGDWFAVCGKIRDYQPMPREVAAVLDADVGAGASYFVIQREIERLGPQGGSEYLRTVVYVPSEEHCRELMDLHVRGTEVAVLVRLVVREPSGDWRGFPTFDPETAFRPWALVSQWVKPRGELVEKNVEARVG